MERWQIGKWVYAYTNCKVNVLKLVDNELGQLFRLDTHKLAMVKGHYH